MRKIAVAIILMEYQFLALGIMPLCISFFYNIMKSYFLEQINAILMRRADFCTEKKNTKNISVAPLSLANTEI